MNGLPMVLEIWGELACFTRPEMKVERYSYPLITPSAARAVFEAIHWKPRYRWQVTRIEVFTPPRYIALRRNEVKNKGPSQRTLRQWMEGRAQPEPLWADGSRETLGTDQQGRTQRQTVALKDVRYRLHARPVPWRGYEAEAGPLAEQFQRRARRGQCVYQPYLGCREFPAWFRLVESDEPHTAPCPLDLDVGWMLYDVFDLSRPGSNTDAPAISVFSAQVKRGVLDVPPYDSPEVRKPAQGGLPC